MVDDRPAGRAGRARVLMWFTAVTRPMFEFFARSIFRWWCPLTVEGRDNLPPLPFIICGNHNSHMDSVALIAAAGYSFNRFAMLAARDYFFRNAMVFNWFSAMVNLIPVGRSASPESLSQTIGECRRFIRDGKHGLILFPEGTRSRSGAIGPFKRGAALFALELRIPVVPAHIEGTRDALPIGTFLPRRGRVRVRFARPVETPAQPEPRILEALLSATRERILLLEAEAHGA